jgi:L-iditol 2-dehydrogenase
VRHPAGRAAALPAPGAIELRAIEPPAPASDEAVVRVAASGVCGTDVDIFEGRIPVAPGRVLGHEGAGIVESAPKGSGLERGERVVVDPVLACGRCSACREDAPNLCLRGGLLGRDHDGVFADWVRVPAPNCVPLPDAVRLDEAPAIQVLATVVHAQELVHVVPGRVAAVIGLGFSGQLHAQLLRRRGARVLGITRSESKRAKAAELACEWTAAPADAAGAVGEVTRDGTVDLVVEASGALSALAQGVELIRPGGTVLWYGTCTATEGALPFYSFYYKEIRLVGARASKPRDMEIAIALVASRAIEIAPLISDRVGLDDVQTALELSSQGTLKVLVEH